MNPVDRENSGHGWSFLLGGAVLVYFIVALEIIIMISPFAFFFYAVFNPILLGLHQSPSTRWLTAFFLPHMIVPPTGVLAAIRVLGSVFFIGGSLVFLVCAFQVYLGKLLKWGVATHGLYRYIRHPQYFGLALAGLGLTILWPRFLTLMLLAVMLFLYYLLAKDEERRMLRHYGEAYQQYLVHTGMFVPRVSKRPAPVRPLTMQTTFLVLVASIGGAAIVGFGLRAYTVAHLPLEHMSGMDVIAIMPEDLPLAKELIPTVRKNSLATQRLGSMESGIHARILAYVLPVDFVMQGMIADTGQEWKLFGRHQTIRMITDYIFHPFAHLHGGHMHQAGITAQQETGVYDSSLMRRIIFLEIHADHSLATPYADFAINNERIPRFFVDVHIHTHEVVRLKDTPTGSGWGDVPTPIF